jgi:hypothetical protein
MTRPFLWQVTCGTELGRLLVDAYASDAAPADEACVARLRRILAAVPYGPGAAQQATYAEEATRLVVAALKWARKQARTAGQRRCDCRAARGGCYAAPRSVVQCCRQIKGGGAARLVAVRELK